MVLKDTVCIVSVNTIIIIGLKGCEFDLTRVRLVVVVVS